MREVPDLITVYSTTGGDKVFTDIIEVVIQADCFVVTYKGLDDNILSTILPMAFVRAIDTEKFADRMIH